MARRAEERPGTPDAAPGTTGRDVFEEAARDALRGGTAGASPAPEVPAVAGDLTPGEDLASVEEHPPELHTEPLDGRIAGVGADAGIPRDVGQMTTRNISGEGGARHPAPVAVWLGPDRRRRQEEPGRWIREDRRLRPYTYGDRRTL
jgi:hypothetical protein